MASVYEHELEGLHELEGELEAELEFEGEGELELEGEGELELEFEGEGELESEISPVRKVYSDAMMEHLGHVAAECETEQEAAEQFLPLIGMAASKLLPVVAKAVAPGIKKALPQMARAITRVQPGLTRGITRITRTLHRNPATRGLLRTIPTIARRTVSSIARQAAHGRPVTARRAILTLANQTRRVLGHPHHRRHALRRSLVLDRHMHRRVAPGIARPHYRHYRSYGRWGYTHPHHYGRIHAYAGHPGVSPAPVPHSHPAAPYGAHPYAPPAPAGPGCPACAGTGAAPQTQYCRCCGQVIR